MARLDDEVQRGITELRQRRYRDRDVKALEERLAELDAERERVKARLGRVRSGEQPAVEQLRELAAKGELTVSEDALFARLDPAGWNDYVDRKLGRVA
jgi:hypothetical protein